MVSPQWILLTLWKAFDTANPPPFVVISTAWLYAVGDVEYANVDIHTMTVQYMIS